jgi:phosphoadenosine phosphosulfate reductase
VNPPPPPGALASAGELEELSAEELLAHLVELFHPRLYVACSFQKETSVMIDMLLRIEPEARFFTLDTGLFFPETYATWRDLERRYGVTVDVYEGMSLERQARLHGDGLWGRDPDACCGLRKVDPLQEALGDVDAWVTGLRREHSPDRANASKFAWDRKHGIWKANPLADWTERDVWRYIHAHDLPYNPLHDRGYASIGCTHCTAPGAGRDGRWAGRDKVDCGLHAG